MQTLFCIEIVRIAMAMLGASEPLFFKLLNAECLRRARK